MTDDTRPEPLAVANIGLREAAARAGRQRYVNGVPCVRGHTDERYTRNAYCVTCQQEANRAAKAHIRALLSKAKGGA